MNAKEALSRKISAQLTLLHLIERALHDRTGYWTLEVHPDKSPTRIDIHPLNVIVPETGEAEILFLAYGLKAYGPSSVAFCLNGETLQSIHIDVTGGDVVWGYSLESAPSL